MKKLIAAYVTDSSAKWLRASDVMKLDILYYAFSTVKDGRPGLYGLENPAFIAGLKRLNPDVKVLVSIGGWGAGGFSEAAATAGGRGLFTRSAMEYIREYGYDGIDMDWEYPCSSAGGIASSPEDKRNFTLLLEDLREGLDGYGRETGRKMYLTAAVGAASSCVEGIECEKAGKILDYINLMTYDMRGGDWSPSGHHTNLFPQTGGEDGGSAEKTVKEYAAAGIPVGKMILGAAFYGRVWVNVTGINQKADRGDVKRFTEIERFCLSDGRFETGYTRYWDKQARAPYLLGNNEFVSYDDEESLRHKCRYISENGLAGIMFWEYGGDCSYKLFDTLTDADSWC